MYAHPVPANEEVRLKELHALSILDTPNESEYDAITTLAATICETPIALISLVDRDRQWFKSRLGVDFDQTERSIAFCTHAIMQDELFVVNDASKDSRFCDNPLVKNQPGIRFYTGMPLISDNGNAIGTLCVIDYSPREITSAQKESLRLLAKQVVELFELRVANQKLRTISESRNRFLKVINHEMRTPLNIIMGYLDLIQEDALSKNDQNIADSCSHAHRAGEQLITMVKDVVDHTSLETGTLKYKSQYIELNSVIRESVLSCGSLGIDRGIKIKLQAFDSSYVLVDPLRLQQIMNNLLNNAIKYSTSESDIVVEIFRDNPKYLSVRVTNIGAEIPADETSLIFDRFFRSSTLAAGGIAGFGLGLSIARDLARLQGGDLILESSVNQMTKFLLTIKG